MAKTMGAVMKTFFLILCAGTGWWSTHSEEWVVQAGVVAVCTLLGTLALALLGIVRRVIFDGHNRSTPTAQACHLNEDDEAEHEQGKIEWVPVQGSSEDPFRNPWHSPDHQNPIDPDRWL